METVVYTQFAMLRIMLEPAVPTLNRDTLDNLVAVHLYSDITLLADAEAVLRACIWLLEQSELPLQATRRTNARVYGRLKMVADLLDAVDWRPLAAITFTPARVERMAKTCGRMPAKEAFASICGSDRKLYYKLLAAAGL